MGHPALVAGGVAIITGAAGGIGLAAAERFADLGMKVALADQSEHGLDAAKTKVARQAAGGEDDVLAMLCDVASYADVERLRDAVERRLGPVTVLMNNAAIDQGAGTWQGRERWQRLLDVNLMGVINGVQAFVPGMVERAAPGAVIMTGSKQGITTPPGNPAYNVSKAAVKVLTEQLAHELRQNPGNKISAHLLIPGFTFTNLTRPGKTDATPKPPKCLDAGTGGRRADGGPGQGRVLPVLPRQRDDPRDGREADALERGGLDSWPPGAVALAPGPRRGVRSFHASIKSRLNEERRYGLR